MRNCVSVRSGTFPYNERDAKAREDTVKSTEARLTGWQVVLISQATFRSSSVGACQSVPRWMNSVCSERERDVRIGKKSAMIFALLPESLAARTRCGYTRDAELDSHAIIRVIRDTRSRTYSLSTNHVQLFRADKVIKKCSCSLVDSCHIKPFSAQRVNKFEKLSDNKSS